MVEKGKIIELENGEEYYIIDLYELENKCFLYLGKIEPSESDSLLFVELVDGSIFPVKDDEIIKKLLLLINKNAS